VYARETDDYILSEATEDSAAPYREGGGAGTLYTGKARSPWYQSAGLAGWQRIKRLQGVGEGGDAHTAVIRCYKDMSTTPFQEAELEFAGTEDRWTWEIRPAQQKYSMFMVEVEIERPSDIDMPPHASDAYEGSGLWIFTNVPDGEFTDSDVGGTITITGSTGGNYDGTFDITSVASGEEVFMSPEPAGGIGAIGAATITFTPAPTAGPDMVGVSLIPVAKEGMEKLPASRRGV
jgi:hypothetical protein